MLASRAAILVVTAALVGLLGNAARPDGVALGEFHSTAVCEGPAAAGPTTALIAPADASALCGPGGAMMADARPAPVFAAGHIAGAVHLPCSASGASAASGLESLAHAGTVIVYGEDTSDAWPVAEALAKRLAGRGVRLLVLDGGFAAWNQAGLACTSGPCDQCQEEGKTIAGHSHP